MAVPMKKPRLDQEVDDLNDLALSQFETWLKDEGFTISNKVRITREGSCAQYGMIAVEDIAEGETLFSIPRSSLLQPQTCAIKDLLQADHEALYCRSQWVPLLVALMYEYNNPNSRWRPYLDLVPNYKELDQPMFWDRDMMQKELQGTSLIEAVESDLKRMKKEYRKVAEPFLKKYPNVFRIEDYGFDLYKKMVAFIMAYSFTEPMPNKDDDDSDNEEEDVPPQPPVMVPLADILNHVVDYNAKLHFSTDILDMISTKHISKGEEVFNTYGELSNTQLLQMYGFTLSNNPHDTVAIPYNTITDEFCEIMEPDEIILYQKCRILERVGLIEEEDSEMIIGPDSILTKEESYEVLKILFMDDEKFSEVWETENWSDSGEDLSLSNDDIPKLQQEWRRVVANSARRRLEEFRTSLESDRELLSKAESESELSRRQVWALRLRHHQKEMLHNIINLCEKAPTTTTS